MTTYLVISIASGLLFAVLDGLINANPLAVKLLSVYKPIARTRVNMMAGILIDLLYGFLLAGLFLLLYPSLPGESGLLKGLSFGLIAWLLRVLMAVLGEWMMFSIPLKTLVYKVLAGLGEMLVIGILYGLTLHP
jgi:hypothetical protein